MAKASSSEIAAATVKGSKSKLPNGDTLHEYRHPSSPDHVISVTTRGGKVMKSNVTYRPFREIEVKAKQERGAKKAKDDKTKSAQKRQLEKKRARSAANVTKKGNRTTR